MKAMYLLIVTLIMMSLTACTTNENDPAEDITSAYILISTYGARSVSNSDKTSNNLDLNDLPTISVAEAQTILAGIRKHEASRKEFNVYETTAKDKKLLKVATSETVSGKYTFSIQLNMTKYDNGTLYYSGYEAGCSSDIFKWYVKGFSFSSDNHSEGNYKFETQSYLYFKISDDSMQFIQVPVSIEGIYNPLTQKADFTYKL